MAKFRVTTERSLGLLYGENPFLIRDIFSKKIKVSVNVFEFDADSKQECIRLFEEAKATGIKNVEGHDLVTITEL